MESFDFNALSRDDQQQTFAFLGLPDNSPMPEYAPDNLGAFSHPMVELPFLDDEAWASFGNEDAGATMSFGLTDETPSQLSSFSVQQEMQSGLHQPLPLVTPSGSSYNMDESSCLGKRNSIIEPATFLKGLGLPLGPMISIQISCDWPSCKSQSQYEIHELESHKMRVHISDVLANWPSHCSWPGCTCKAVFKTSKRLESHVYNIHITPLCCVVDGCTHRRPFERQADLYRHVQSKHENERNHKCSRPSCLYSFTRKDKLKLHLKNYHERYACNYSHCNMGFSSGIGLENHSRFSHVFIVGFECALGTCANMPSSSFRAVYILRHLIKMHNCPEIAAEGAVERLRYALPANAAITIDDFPDGIPGFKGCEECKKLRD